MFKAKPVDPLLRDRAHRRNRAHWLKLRLPCARCGRMPDYDKPHGFVVGHIVDRAIARRAGWTAAQINALSNSQPECPSCSRKSGASLGGRIQGAKRKAGRNTSRDWYRRRSEPGF